ncbi:MAG TPA: acyltransferase [Planktothrix sp.]|jgi:peptidoglycan/LPS O-acetylase OafA/YrhL
MSTSPDRKNRTFFPELAGLRTFAFWGIFLSHYNPSPTLSYWGNRIADWGWASVDLFFCLSGFLITYLLLQERQEFGSVSIKNFYMRRILRIWPLYYLVIACMTVYPLLHMNAARMDCYWRYINEGILPFLAFLGNFVLIFNLGSIVHLFHVWHLPEIHLITVLLPFWSLCIEEQFYFVWPWMLKPIKRTSTLFVLYIALTVASFIGFSLLRRFVAFSGVTWTHFYYNTPSHIGAIMLGAMLGTAECKAPGWATKLVGKSGGFLLALVLLLGFAGIVKWMPSISTGRGSLDFVFPGLCIGCAGLLLLTLYWPPMRRLASNRIFVWLSNLTYCMYVVHFFIGDVCGGLIPGNICNTEGKVWLAHLIIGSTLTFGVALVSWYCLESKMLALRKYFRREKLETVAATNDLTPERELVKTGVS